jgi:hypothetical protein
MVSTRHIQKNIKLSASKYRAFTIPVIAQIIIYQSYEKLMNLKSEVSSCHGGKCQDKDLPQRDHVQFIT